MSTPGVNYKVSGDAAELKKAFDDAHHSMKSSFGKMNEQVNALQAQMQGALGTALKWTGIGAALGGTVGAFELLKQSIEGAAKVEVDSRQWDGLFPIAAKANQVLKELRDSMEINGVEFGPAKEGAAVLLKLGDNTEQVVGHMRMLADVARLSGVSLEGLASAFASGLQTPNIGQRQAREFDSLGVDLTGMFMQSLNKSKQEVDRLFSSGALGFNDLVEAFRVATSEGHKFYNGAARMADTLEGKWDAFTTTINRVKTAFGGELLIPLKAALEQMTEWAASLVDKARQFGATIAEAVQTFRGMMMQGTLGEAAGLGLKIALAEGANFLAAGIAGALAGGATAIWEALKGIWSLLSDASTWSALRDLLVKSADAMADILVSALRSVMPGMKPQTPEEVHARRLLTATNVEEMIPGLAEAMKTNPQLRDEVNDRYFPPVDPAKMSAFRNPLEDPGLKHTAEFKQGVVDKISELSGLASEKTRAANVQSHTSAIADKFTQAFNSTAKIVDPAKIAGWEDHLKNITAQAQAVNGPVGDSPFSNLANLDLFLPRWKEINGRGDAASDIGSGKLMNLSDALSRVGLLTGRNNSGPERIAERTARGIDKAVQVLTEIKTNTAPAKKPACF